MPTKNAALRYLDLVALFRIGGSQGQSLMYLSPMPTLCTNEALAEFVALVIVVGLQQLTLPHRHDLLTF